MVRQATIAKGYKIGLVLVTWYSELTHLSFYFDMDYQVYILGHLDVSRYVYNKREGICLVFSQFLS